MPRRRVLITIPEVLAQLVGGERQFEVEATTVGEALATLVQKRAALGVHLFDDAGELRRHVVCLHDGAYARGRGGLEREIAAGEPIAILNAVSGG